ncbi:hypothetical protein [Paraburkholderia phytofirmans]|uniref:Uncharacterized protein n=1 Tax=Paraburkholderia phytofirmans (strain DSM 17436 / LMG 22146 / PsJN) TaxID=398527 RepID=B2TH48_PARPJ|nr:hypothetical protein [Paraburkholderia phytofirmans]ACD21597.1 hypothetical protein Bphyt_7312 [Paraburkholderia phytofirmans PsJN]
MVQFAEIIRAARHRYLETGETAGYQAIGVGMCEDAALDILVGLAPADEDAQTCRDDDPSWLAGLSFDYEPFDSDALLFGGPRLN